MSRKPLITRHPSAPAVTTRLEGIASADVAAAPVASQAAVTQPGKRAARPVARSSSRVERSPRPARTADVAPTRALRTPETTRDVVPVTADVAAAAPGRRRAATASRGPLFKGLPSAPILAGVAALAVSAGGAVTAGPALSEPPSSSTRVAAASSLSQATDLGLLEDRGQVVSRDSRRVARTERVEATLQKKAEAALETRTEALETLTVQADKYSAKIEANQWVMPVSGYRLSATYGMTSSLWSTVHTGLDFAAPAGTPLRAVANGVVTETGYDGSYGNKTVITLDDGTEVWYCHQTSISVSVGDSVVGGETIGSVGSTGNSTGAHLHLEIRPGGGDPVDPYRALLSHGLQP